MQILASILNRTRSITTYSVPRINATAGLISSVLHLLELSDGDGAECEHLRKSLAGRGRPIGRETYAEHDPIGKEGFEGHTHGCEGCDVRCRGSWGSLASEGCVG